MTSARARLSIFVLLVAAILLAVVSCGGKTTGSGTGKGGKPEVVVALYPLQWVADRVGGADIHVTNLTSPGVEPHDLELSPQQVAQIGSAALSVYIKGVQPSVDQAIDQNAAEKSLDAAGLVKTLPIGENADHDHDHDVAYDPHIWLDPTRLATVAASVGDRLAAIDPGHAKQYKERAAATVADLTALDEEFAKGLSGCGVKTLVTSHEAFGYLADRYHLKQVGITFDPENEPSPARIAEVAKIAKREKVTTIFTEALASPKVAEVLAREVGAKIVVLDPLESKPAHGDYLSAMRANLQILRTALGCS